MKERIQSVIHGKPSSTPPGFRWRRCEVKVKVKKSDQPWERPPFDLGHAHSVSVRGEGEESSLSRGRRDEGKDSCPLRGRPRRLLTHAVSCCWKCGGMSRIREALHPFIPPLLPLFLSSSCRNGARPSGLLLFTSFPLRLGDMRRPPPSPPQPHCCMSV